MDDADECVLFFKRLLDEEPAFEGVGFDREP
jgi:hypothetical protein